MRRLVTIPIKIVNRLSQRFIMALGREVGAVKFTTNISAKLLAADSVVLKF
jgi:hypothetical protein